MKLVFEKGSAGRRLDLISPCDVPQVSFEKAHIREKQPRLPHMSENEISRHYTELAKRSHGVNDGFYPLGSCTMKYNPKVNEEAAALKGSPSAAAGGYGAGFHGSFISGGEISLRNHGHGCNDIPAGSRRTR